MILDQVILYRMCHYGELVLKTFYKMDLSERFNSILVAFEEFLMLTESEDWCVNITDNVVLDMFMMASRLEIFCKELEDRRLKTEFAVKLAEFWRVRGRRTGDLSFDFYEKVCDVLLSKFLTDSRLNDSQVKVALDQYVLHCGETRLKAATKSIIATRQAYLELSNFVVENCDNVDIEARIIFESWTNRLNSRNEHCSSLDEAVMEMLSADLKSVKILFCILCFNAEDEEELENIKLVKNCIISKITTSASCLRNKSVWKVLLKLPYKNLKSIVKDYPVVLDTIFDAITNSVEQFTCEYTDEKMVCVNNSSNLLSYEDVVSLLKILFKIGGSVEERAKTYFHSRKTSNMCILFEDIEADVLRTHEKKS